MMRGEQRSRAAGRQACSKLGKCLGEDTCVGERRSQRSYVSEDVEIQ